MVYREKAIGLLRNCAQEWHEPDFVALAKSVNDDNAEIVFKALATLNRCVNERDEMLSSSKGAGGRPTPPEYLTAREVFTQQFELLRQEPDRAEFVVMVRDAIRAQVFRENEGDQKTPPRRTLNDWFDRAAAENPYFIFENETDVN